MNTAHGDEQNRTIRVRDFLADFRAGMPDGDLMEKYHLTPTGLDRFYTMLVDKDILDSRELIDHQSRRDPQEWASTQDQSSEADSGEGDLICPACYHAQATPFDVCPSCGGKVEDLAQDGSRYETPERYQPNDPGSETDETDEVVSEWSLDEDKPVMDKASVKQPVARPIEIPLQEKKMDPLSQRAVADEGRDRFRIPEFNVARPDPAQFGDDVEPGFPFDYDEVEERPEIKGPTCEECEFPVRPTLRRIYDRGRSFLALAFSGIFLLLGFAGAFGVTLFQGYSLLRLAVIYLTGMSILLGCIFLALGIFMLLLAREKVYCCEGCGRVYPFT